MSMLELNHVSLGPLADLTVAIDPGHHVVLGRTRDGSDLLIELISGLRRPRRGRVRLGGSDPWRSPTLRGTVGTLLAREQLPPAATVGGALSCALRIRGEAREARDVLEELKLVAWGSRSVDSLTPGECRSLALALALSIRRPAVLALYEPLADLPGIAHETILQRLELAASEGACVLSVTCSARDASRLSSSVLLLDRGRIVRCPGLPLPLELAPGTTPDLVVRTGNPRMLAGRLASEDDVAGVHWDEARAPGELRVRGPDPNRVSMAVMRAARQARIPVTALSPTLPALDSVRAASAGLARAAYDHAYLAARAATGSVGPWPPGGPAGTSSGAAPAGPAPGSASVGGPTATTDPTKGGSG